MWNPDRNPLPDWIQDAYEVLEPAFEDTDTGLSRDEAEELLLETAAVIDEPGDSVHALDRLLERGWLYEVDGELRKTD